MKTSNSRRAWNGALGGRTGVAVVALGASVLSVASAWGQRLNSNREPVSWREGEFSVKGPNCGENNTYLIANGSQVSIIFTTLGVSLPNRRGRSELKRTCKIELPYRMRGGAKFSMQQTIQYGVVKIPGAEGAIKVDGSVFGSEVRLLRLDFKNGDRLNEPLLTRTFPVPGVRRDEPWRTDRVLCIENHSDNGKDGTVKLEFEVGTKLNAANGAITLVADGSDLRYDLELDTDSKACKRDND